MLLDTQAVIWYAEGNVKLPKFALNTMHDASEAIHISVATFWEIAIKISIGKLKIQENTVKGLMSELLEQGFVLVHIEPAHLTLLETLPFHHRDPFDRMLAAQCLASDLTIVSSDSIFDSYQISRIWD